jgi:NADPH2:quinone reductase
MPLSLNFAQAVTVPVAALTAFQSLFHAEKGALISGRKVFINGAAVEGAALWFSLRRPGGLNDSGSCGSGNVGYVKSRCGLAAVS